MITRRQLSRLKNDYSSISTEINEQLGSQPIETSQNHVYFYSEVNSEKCLRVFKQLKDLDDDLDILQNSLGERLQIPIWLHLQTGGGDLLAALSLVDQMQQLKMPIYSIVEGICASAGTLIALACSKRYILPRSLMMIHQLSTFFSGTYEEFKDEVEMQNMLMDIVMDLYLSRSKLDKAQLTEMLKRNTWLNAQKCLEYGFVDEIVSSEIKV